MSILKKMLPYLLICCLAFYVTPLIGTDTGGFIFLLLIAIPIVCFAVSLIYGILNTFVPLQLLFPIFVGILFIPTIYIFYNDTAWIYPMAYAIISLAGNLIGYGIRILINMSGNKK